jgi:hypothetical protein
LDDYDLVAGWRKTAIAGRAKAILRAIWGGGKREAGKVMMGYPCRD